MLRRVLRFVLLIATACGSPREPAQPGEPAAPSRADAAAAAADVVAAAPDPAPPPPPPAPPASPPSPSGTRRILSIRLVGSELELVVDGGARAGIRKDWVATLVDAGDHVIPVKLRIVTVGEDRTVVMARATRDQVGDKRVRLVPAN
jgi:hypothetical protein